MWLSNNYKWLFDGIGAVAVIAFIGYLLKRFVFTESRNLPVQISHSPTSLTGTGNIGTGHITNLGTLNIAQSPTHGSVPPAAPSATAPDKPLPNIRQTGVKVIRVNDYSLGRVNEDREGKEVAIVIQFTNEARAGYPNVGGSVKALLVYENGGIEVLRIIAGWIYGTYDSKRFLVDESHKLVVGFAAIKGLVAYEVRRKSNGDCVMELREVPEVQTVIVRLTHATYGDILFEGRYLISFHPVNITALP